MTLSQDPYQRNFTLGQQGSQYDFRLRTTTTTTNGIPSLSTPSGTLIKELTHVVYTRDATGMARLYLDGLEWAKKTVGGNSSNWSSGYRLALGNELQNFDAGP